MPSVRIRRGSYLSLRDDVPAGITSPLPRRSRGHTITLPVANIFPPADVNDSEIPSLTVNAVEDAEDNRPLTNNDPQSSIPRLTLRSRVSDHILQGSRSRAGLRTQLTNLFTERSSSRERASSLEGPQAEGLLRTGDHLGRIGSALSLRSTSEADHASVSNSEHHDDDIVEHLDAIDPQIGTVTTLTNAANSIVIPPFSFYSRRPIVALPTLACDTTDAEKTPDGSRDDLDRHVEDVLNKRHVFRRTMQGVWAFVKTPQGIVTAVYGFCVAFWGAAIVIFLLKIINLHNANTQGFWVEVSSQVTNALFTVTGVGLIPWRVRDTYRIIKIWHYKRKTTKLRKKAGLPELYDEDDLPDPIYDINYVHVLTDAEQADLHYQQKEFMKSQTWYRPHGTETHRAFPINTALLICFLVDGNSAFQCILCGCMWGLNRFQRPAWTTGSLIPLSFLCGIFSAVFIWRGGQKTKRTELVKERMRIALATQHTHSHQDLGVPVEPETPSSLSQPAGSSRSRLNSVVQDGDCVSIAMNERTSRLSSARVE